MTPARRVVGSPAELAALDTLIAYDHLGRAEVAKRAGIAPSTLASYLRILRIRNGMTTAQLTAARSRHHRRAVVA